MQIPSQYLEQVVDQLASLPGIGRRTALRLALDLLKRSEVELSDFISALTALQDKVLHCRRCGNIADTQICQICNNSRRDSSLICVVEDIRDVMAVESTASFRGVYHVLGGKISPMDGVGPHDLKINSLVEKVRSGRVKELIFALSSTMEGDTTNFYIFKQIQDTKVVISTIARGISVGDELEYADEVTLGRSITNRIPFELSIKS